MSKTALVVDDSRVALHALRRLLTPKGILVDTAESGPEALDYLRSNPLPAAVFLDHMMPGMDGFETLAALKSDPRTAAIPVVMYTSQDGDAYMDEARSLGAVDVLYKPVQPAELDRILTSLRFPDSDEARPRTVAPDGPGHPSAQSPDVQSVSHAEPGRVAAPRAAEPIDGLPFETAEAASVSRVRSVSLVLGLVLLLFAAGAWWSYEQYRQAEAARVQVLSENMTIKKALAEQTALAQHASAMAKTLSEREPPLASGRALLDTVAWALNRHSRFEFGETPLNDERADLLRNLLERLTEADFRGAVRVETHVGEFCLTRDKEGHYRLPAIGTPFSRCEVISYRPADAQALGSRRTDAFTRVLNEHALARSPIDVAVASLGTTRPLRQYPNTATVRLASEWNTVARFNQRVEIVIEPRATR